jgi:hypothetical protein
LISVPMSASSHPPANRIATPIAIPMCFMAAQCSGSRAGHGLEEKPKILTASGKRDGDAGVRGRRFAAFGTNFSLSVNRRFF